MPNQSIRALQERGLRELLLYRWRNALMNQNELCLEYQWIHDIAGGWISAYPDWHPLARVLYASISRKSWEGSRLFDHVDLFRDVIVASPYMKPGSKNEDQALETLHEYLINRRDVDEFQEPPTHGPRTTPCSTVIRLSMSLCGNLPTTTYLLTPFASVEESILQHFEGAETVIPGCTYDSPDDLTPWWLLGQFHAYGRWIRGQLKREAPDPTLLDDYRTVFMGSPNSKFRSPFIDSTRSKIVNMFIDLEKYAATKSLG